MNVFAFLLPFLILVAVAIVAVVIAVILVLVWGLLGNSESGQEYENLEPKQEYGVKSVTLRGETVKSIGEKRIADYFEKNNIAYFYEHEARGKSLFFDCKISSPDFYLPGYNVYVEYWGLVKADDNRTRTEYVRNMKRKMAIYFRNNVKFISIYPDNLGNLDWIFRRKFREITGFELPS